MYTGCDDASESYEDAAVDELDSDPAQLISPAGTWGVRLHVPGGAATIIKHFERSAPPSAHQLFSLAGLAPQNSAIDKFRFGLRFDDLDLSREALRYSLEF